METLRQKQSRFALEIARLIVRASGELGIDVTYGEAWRSPEEAERLWKAGLGIKNSVHCDRLAIDLNVFKNGIWQTTEEGHRPLGELWESMGPDHRWGGRFKDGNHYSFEHEGRK